MRSLGDDQGVCKVDLDLNQVALPALERQVELNRDFRVLSAYKLEVADVSRDIDLVKGKQFSTATLLWGFPKYRDFNRLVRGQPYYPVF